MTSFLDHDGDRIILVVPRSRNGSGRVKLTLPASVAEWLHSQLGEALGLPRQKARRPVRLRRGIWQENKRARPRRPKSDLADGPTLW